MASNPPTPPDPSNFYEWQGYEKFASSQPSAGRAQPTPSSPEAGMSLEERLKLAAKSNTTIRREMQAQKAGNDAALQAEIDARKAQMAAKQEARRLEKENQIRAQMEKEAKWKSEMEARSAAMEAKTAARRAELAKASTQAETPLKEKLKSASKTPGYPSSKESLKRNWQQYLNDKRAQYIEAKRLAQELAQEKQFQHDAKAAEKRAANAAARKIELDKVNQEEARIRAFQQRQRDTLTEVRLREDLARKDPETRAIRQRKYQETSWKNKADARLPGILENKDLIAARREMLRAEKLKKLDAKLNFDFEKSRLEQLKFEKQNRFVNNLIKEARGGGQGTESIKGKNVMKDIKVKYPKQYAGWKAYGREKGKAFNAQQFIERYKATRNPNIGDVELFDPPKRPMPMSSSGEIKGPSKLIGKQNILTPQDENLYYRAVREGFNQPARAAVDDFLSTGQIRGTQRYGGEAYFARGAYWDPAKQWTAWGAAPDSPSEMFPGQPRSYQITVDPTKVNAATNPLYGNEAGWKNKYFGNPKDFAITYNPTSGGQATYPVLQPAKEPGLLSTLNPGNRSGIKIVGNTGEVVYDRVTPVAERPFSTHAANVKAEAKIAGNVLSKGAGKVASVAGKVAGPTLIGYDAYTKAQEGRARGDDPKVTGSTYTTDAVLNFVTLGGSDFAKWYYLATPKEREEHWNTVGERYQREAESGWTY